MYLDTPSERATSNRQLQTPSILQLKDKILQQLQDSATPKSNATGAFTSNQ